MATELKPLHDLIKPGIPCEVENCTDNPKHKYVTTAKWDGEKMDQFIGCEHSWRPVWRLAPPKPVIEWQPHHNASESRCGKFMIAMSPDKENYHWIASSADTTRWFKSRDEAVQWCEQQAR